MKKVSFRWYTFQWWGATRRSLHNIALCFGAGCTKKCRFYPIQTWDGGGDRLSDGFWTATIWGRFSGKL